MDQCRESCCRSSPLLEMSGAAASLSCCRSSAPTQIARNWRFNNGFQGQCNHGTRSIVAILKLPDVPGQPHARRTVGIAAFDLKSIKVDAGVRADTCYAAFRPRRCNPRRGAFTSAPLRFKQGAKATSSSPVRASLCHHQILGPSSSLPSKRLQRCKFPGGKQLHHCPIKLGKGAKLNKALSTRAIFDFDWSDSPRGWAERASTFLPPLAPDPVKFQRKRLDLKFAVLLMRSSYEAVDELDFVPMDRFQVKVSTLMKCACLSLMEKKLALDSRLAIGKLPSYKRMNSCFQARPLATTQSESSVVCTCSCSLTCTDT